MAVTGETIVSLAFDDYRDSARPSTALLVKLLDSINRETYQMLYSIRPEYYITTSALTFTNDEASFPTGFKTINADHAEVVRLNSDGDTIETLHMTGYGSRNRGFWLNDKTSKIVLTPSGTDSSDLSIRFIPALTQITSLGQDLVIPEGHEMYGVYKLLIEDVIMQSQPADTQRRFEEKANQEMDKMILDFRSEPARIYLNTHTPTRRLSYLHKH